MEAQESEDDTEEFLAQFQLPPSSIKVDWETLLPPGGWKCPSDHHDNSHDLEHEGSSGSVEVNCAGDRCGLDSSSMASNKELQDKVTEYVPDEALLKELGYSDSEDDAPDLTYRHLVNPAEDTAKAPPSELAYTATAQPTGVNPVYLSIPPAQRLYKLVNNQMARFKHSFAGSSEPDSVSNNMAPLSKSFSEVPKGKVSSSKAPSSLLRRPYSEPIRKFCSHPPANFVVSPSCPYFGLVPSHVEIEIERRQARRAQREPRIDRVFMDELHNLWTERRKTRHMVKEFIQNVIDSATQRLEEELQGSEVTNDLVHNRWMETKKTHHMVKEFIQNVIDSATKRLEAELQGSEVTNDMVHNRWSETRKNRHMVEGFIQNLLDGATERLEAELHGVIQPPRVSGQVSTACTSVVDKQRTQQTGAVSSEVTNDVAISSAGTSTVIGSKIAAMRQLLEQQIDRNPFLDGPSSSRPPNTAVKYASQNKGTKAVSPRIMEAIDRLSGETEKKADVPTSGDTAIELTREAFRHLRNRMAEKATLEVKVEHMEPNNKHVHTEKTSEDRSVADIRKHLEAKMAEGGDKTFSGKGTLVLPLPLGREEEHSAGDSAESFSERKTYLDKEHVHDTLEAKDDNSSQTLSNTCYEILESPAKMTPLSKSSRSLPDTRILTEEAASTPQPATSAAKTYCGDGTSTVRKTVLKLEQDADKKADRKEDIAIPRRQSSQASEMFLKLKTADESEKDERKKLDVQTPEGCVRDTVDNIEKLHHRHDQSGGKEEENTAPQSLDSHENEFHTDGAMYSYTRTIVRLNLFYWLLDKIYSLYLNVVDFVNSYLP